MTIIEAEGTRISWGVHQGKTLAEIAAADVSYFDYLLSIQFSDMFLRAAVAVMAEKYGRKAKAGSQATGGPKQMTLF